MKPSPPASLAYRRRPLFTLMALGVAFICALVEFQLYTSYSETGSTTREFARTTDATTALANVQREALTIIAAVSTLEEGDSLTRIDVRRGLLERQLEVFASAVESEGHDAGLARLQQALGQFDSQLEVARDGTRARNLDEALVRLRPTMADIDKRVKRLFDQEEHALYQALGTALDHRSDRQRLLVLLGAFGFLLAAAATIVVRRTIRSDFTRAYEALSTEVQERKSLQSKLSHQALHDSLTGLANRVLFRDELDLALRDSTGGRLGVLYIDLDGFKAVNDGFGHDAGDELLRQAADRLRDRLRPDNKIARLGGDEFAVLVPYVNAESDVTNVASRLLTAMADPFVVAGRHTGVGASIGVAIVEPGAIDAEAVLSHADLAMYAAKKDGKGGFRMFSPEMSEAACARGQLEEQLRGALDAGQLEMHYQPIVDVETEAPVGLEALMRWRHPERGLLVPLHFLELAEEVGLMVPLGQWALEQACQEAAGWTTDGCAPWVSVNISPRQLREPRLVDHVAHALQVSGLDPSRLMLEISELTILNDQRSTARVLAELRQLGVRIALDDFGTGYSSLGFLRFLPIDVLKIDKCFVDQLTDKSHGARLAHAILRFGDQIRLTTVAEGVESADQLDTLRAAGCHLAQGYHFSRPVPAADVGPLLLRGIRRVAAARRLV